MADVSAVAEEAALSCALPSCEGVLTGEQCTEAFGAGKEEERELARGAD